MDLLERLRPRWRHPDPEVRLAAVREMAGDDAGRLAEVARTDGDARVRRVAIRKLDDAGLLAEIAQRDADASLRELADERARQLLVAAATAAGPLADCDAALARLADERSLGVVAATAAHAAIRRRALERVSADRVLRDVVRTATDAAVRHDALARIGDPAMLRAVAVADVPAELAFQAVDRVDDADVLRAIAEHPEAAKAVRQRARSRLPAGSAEAIPVGHKEARARQLALCLAAEGLAAEVDVLGAAARLDPVRHEWDALAREVAPRDDVAARFAAACAALLADAESGARRRAEAEHARAAVERALEARELLCAEVEALEGADVATRVAAARRAWAALPPVTGDRAATLARRFAAACGEAAARGAQRVDGAARREAVEALVAEAETLAAATPMPRRRTWQAVEARWAARAPSLPEPDGVELAARFTAARERLQRRQDDATRERSARAEANRVRLDGLGSRLEAMADGEALKPAAARRALEAAEAALRDLGPLPPGEQRAAWTARLSAARDRLTRRLRELEETEEWRRWANAGAQEEIIRRVEGLLESGDLAEGTRQLAHLQDEWRAVASATRDRSQALWERFRAARNELRRRCDAYLAENLEKKRALCARVADVADSTAWTETAALIRAVQEEWKAVGPVPARHAQAVWRQLREPCDRFFARRREHFAVLDAARQEAVTRKTALCERAEALADSTDWEATAAAMRALQAEWKQSAPVPRAEGEALWQRFRAACDRFFDRRSRREELARDAVRDRARALCARLEALADAAGGPDAPAADDVRQEVDATWAEWLRLELPRPDAVELSERMHAACARLAAARAEYVQGTRLDPQATRARREKLCARAEALAGSAAPPPPRELSVREMALALRERLATNTIARGAAHAATPRPDAVRELERLAASWLALGPALDADSRALAERFERARATVAATRPARRA
jgi:hypothetical protein